MFAKRKAAKAARAEILAENAAARLADPPIGIMPTEKGQIILYRDRIEKKFGRMTQTMMLNEFTSAEFSESGGTGARTTLVRAATVGNGWQKETDNTRMTLTISNGTDFWMEDVTPSLKMARNNFRICGNKFAMQVNMAVHRFISQSA